MDTADLQPRVARSWPLAGGDGEEEGAEEEDGRPRGTWGRLPWGTQHDELEDGGGGGSSEGGESGPEGGSEGGSEGYEEEGWDDDLGGFVVEVSLRFLCQRSKRCGVSAGVQLHAWPGQRACHQALLSPAPLRPLHCAGRRRRCGSLP